MRSLFGCKIIVIVAISGILIDIYYCFLANRVCGNDFTQHIAISLLVVLCR